MNRLLSTDAVPRDQRLAYWTDMICNIYVQLGCDPVRNGPPGDFEGSIRQHTLPALDVSVVRSAGWLQMPPVLSARLTTFRQLFGPRMTCSTRPRT